MRYKTSEKDARSRGHRDGIDGTWARLVEERRILSLMYTFSGEVLRFTGCCSRCSVERSEERSVERSKERSVERSEERSGVRECCTRWGVGLHEVYLPQLMYVHFDWD